MLIGPPPKFHGTRDILHIKSVTIAVSSQQLQV